MQTKSPDQTDGEDEELPEEEEKIEKKDKLITPKKPMKLSKTNFVAKGLSSIEESSKEELIKVEENGGNGDVLSGFLKKGVKEISKKDEKKCITFINKIDTESCLIHYQENHKIYYDLQ